MQKIKNINKFKELEQMLKTFDYTYIFSDDFGVWKFWAKKEVEVEKLILELMEIDIEKVQKLIDKYKCKYGVRFTLKSALKQEVGKC